MNPFQLKNKKWPPSNTVYTVEAGDIPICAVLKRATKNDFSGYIALGEGRNNEALKDLSEAIKVNCGDEMVFYNFARALCNEGKYESADSLLKKGLGLNPYSESILMYLGNISAFRNDSVVAGEYYRKLIGVNRKYLDAYVSLARLEAVKDPGDARKLLTECLGIDPCYKPAVKELADSYRKSDPETAAKYDNLLNSLK